MSFLFLCVVPSTLWKELHTEGSRRNRCRAGIALPRVWRKGEGPCDTAFAKGSGRDGLLRVEESECRRDNRTKRLPFASEKPRIKSISVAQHEVVVQEVWL
jgi:hypothetical protein